MKKHDLAYIREPLEELSTHQLDEMLQAELKKDSINDDLVRLILSVLEDRESNRPQEVTPEVEKSWTRYLTHTAAPKEKLGRKNRGMLKAASIVLALLALLAVVPQEAEATGFFERIAQWTESIFEFFSPGSIRAESAEYVFETDNPGLQEVYDTLVELGVTEPVVPMWLPEGYELGSCEIYNTPIKDNVTILFSKGKSHIVFIVDIYRQAPVNQRYEKDDTDVCIYDIEETFYNVIHNIDHWVVVWTKSNLECSLTIDCQEDTLHKIIKSIHKTGE